MISKFPRFQGSKVKEFHRFRGSLKFQGFQWSKKGCRANLFLKGTERFPHVTRAFKGYKAPNPRVLGAFSSCFQKVSWVGNRMS